MKKKFIPMVKLFTGCVMSGKTKLLIDFILYSTQNEYIILGPDVVYETTEKQVKTRCPGYEAYDFNLIVSPSTDLVSYVENHLKSNKLKVIYCEEIQFWDKKLIDQLVKIEKDFKIEVRCFGFSKSHKNETWDMITYLLQFSCDITTLFSECCFCKMPATTNIRSDCNLEADELDPINDNGEEKYLGCCESCHVKKIREKKIDNLKTCLDKIIVNN